VYALTKSLTFLGALLKKAGVMYVLWLPESIAA